jgi:hypothetical protein
MALVKVATVTDTMFHVHLAGSVPPSVSRAMGEWCMAHGIDPALVPATSPIVRDPVQSDRPPAPFPAEVLAWGERIK